MQSQQIFSAFPNVLTVLAITVSSKTGSLATNLKDTLCLTILGLSTRAIFQFLWAS